MTDLLDSLLDPDRYQPGAATPAIAERLARFKRDALAKAARTSPRDVEVKQEETKHLGGRTYYVLEVGMVADDGTYAAIFCRDYRHLVVGPRGGVTLLNAKRRKDTRFNPSTCPKGWWNALWALV